jgi:excisionase family DNA binding protein
MQTNVIVIPVTLDELVSRLKAELSPAAPVVAITPNEEFFTAKEAAKRLQISLVTLHKWKADGKLKFYRFGSRVRFKWSEIENAGKFNKARA